MVGSPSAEQVYNKLALVMFIFDIMSGLVFIALYAHLKIRFAKNGSMRSGSGTLRVYQRIPVKEYFCINSTLCLIVGSFGKASIGTTAFQDYVLYAKQLSSSEKIVVFGGLTFVFAGGAVGNALVVYSSYKNFLIVSTVATPNRVLKFISTSTMSFIRVNCLYYLFIFLQAMMTDQMDMEQFILEVFIPILLLGIVYFIAIVRYNLALFFMVKELRNSPQQRRLLKLILVQVATFVFGNIPLLVLHLLTLFLEFDDPETFILFLTLSQFAATILGMLLAITNAWKTITGAGKKRSRARGGKYTSARIREPGRIRTATVTTQVTTVTPSSLSK